MARQKFPVTNVTECKRHRVQMPRYFFNTRIGGDLIADREGTELRDPDHAWEMARATILQLLRAGEPGGKGPIDLMNAILEVTDEAGEIVLEFPFTEALLDSPGSLPTVH